MITQADLDTLEQHWAVSALPSNERSWADKTAELRLTRQAVGDLMTFETEESSDAGERLERVAMGYELAAIEALDSLIAPSADGAKASRQALAGAFRSYGLRQVCTVPSGDEERMFHVLHLAALAYCGDRWPDLRRWMKTHEGLVAAPTVAEAVWEQRVLFCLFDCWVRLFRKASWDDVDQVREIVAGLREDQRTYEKEALDAVTGPGARTLALRLVALYHWARATERLAIYTLQGEPPNVRTELDQHFEKARAAAAQSGDAIFEVILRWLHAAAVRMAAGSIWSVSQAVNSRVTRFVTSVTKTRALFELLPPQRAAIQEQGLLDQASRAVVVDLPTSGGKTALAQFRMLQALNQFAQDNGWVAYIAPTRALVAQLTRRLRQDFSPLGIRVEQLSGAVEVDAFEEAILSDPSPEAPFHVLIATPEKLHLVIRNKKVVRPLALVVMDEAHNLEDEERGLRIELLLATIKRDCRAANFLLLMPFVPNAGDLARWLGAEAGRTISLGTTPWQPNQRIVGLFGREQTPGIRGGWRLRYETLTTSPKTMLLAGQHHVGPARPLDVAYSDAGVTLQTGAMARVFSQRGTSIAVAKTIPHVWKMAAAVAKSLPLLEPLPPEIALVQRFLQTEMGEDFALVQLLKHGVGVHHRGISDEAQTLMEWLAELGKLRVLCATTTIAQWINFPVSSVFLASNQYPYGREMSPREFWNLAGRAGRMDQESVGVVGIAAGERPDAIRSFVAKATGALISQLVRLLDEVERSGRLNQMELVIAEPQWADFRCYIAHLLAQKKNLEAVLGETEQLLRATYGFEALRGGPGQNKADALLKATNAYARKLSEHPENATLADLTGFAPEGVAAALIEMGQMEHKLKQDDWEPASLFGKSGSSALPGLFGVLLKVPQVGKALRELGSHGINEDRFAEVTSAWVNGRTLPEIAREFFEGDNPTNRLTDACRAIYKVLTNNGCWGLSALSKIPNSGLDFDALSEEQRQRINLLPAMIYHGVRTDAAVLMRMNSVPRSVAEPLGAAFEEATGQAALTQRSGRARDFLRSLDADDWERVVPLNSAMTGADYREVWCRLSGEGDN